SSTSSRIGTSAIKRIEHIKARPRTLGGLVRGEVQSIAVPALGGLLGSVDWSSIRIKTEEARRATVDAHAVAHQTY
ncbi:MAG: hypothetical protein OXN89_11875, partial [Bryobacterales bacterium]|nr:hypothetical protein [Bryobacterales bacterium]